MWPWTKKLKQYGKQKEKITILNLKTTKYIRGITVLEQWMWGLERGPKEKTGQSHTLDRVRMIGIAQYQEIM